jgi:ABC-2 type transport system permease protein
MVVVVPPEPLENIEEDQQSNFLIYHNEIDPFQISYVKAVASGFIDKTNNEFLQTTIEQEQENSGTIQADLENAIVQVQRIQQISPSQEAAELERDLVDINERLTTFRTVTSETLVTPFISEEQGLANLELTITMFFAPAVIALLLQHFSITFASLSIVRESNLGVMELFRVSPITAFETLVGKYLSYFFFEIILAGIITVLAIWLLDIPMIRNLQNYALAVAALLFASLGMGFLISLISQNDTQAVQYSMLLLLASIFFSGFLLDLRMMKEPVTFLSWGLPSTYGVRMFQDIMLRGADASSSVLLGITAIGTILFLLNWLLLQRKIGT